jgi:hypothetical protein
MKRQIVIAVLACAVVLPAHAADPITGSQLYRACRAPKDSSSHQYCRAYIAGFFGGFAVSTQANRLIQFCPPQGLTTEQIWKKIEPFLKPHRDQAEDELVSTALGIALVEAYGCKKRK